jgi:hypothetical protein
MTDMLSGTAPLDLVPGPVDDRADLSGPEGVQPALLRRVRAGRNKDFDRVVFDLDGPVPGVMVQYVPQLQHQGTGDVIPMRGRAVVQVDIRPAVAHHPDGSPSRTGPLPDLTGFAAFRQLADAGDFEAQLTWGIGVAARTGLRASTLTGPSRVAVDVWHAEPGTGDQLLRSGDRGAAVATWQWRLVQALDRPVPVDEHFGPITDAATREFQRAQQLTVDGIVGRRTRAAMVRALGL